MKTTPEEEIKGTMQYYRIKAKTDQDIADLVGLIDRMKSIMVGLLEARLKQDKDASKEKGAA